MHTLVLLLAYIVGASQGATSTANTWYVRADGAPHYSSSIAGLAWRGLDPKHTCDGLHDAAWPAVGSLNVLGLVSDGQNQPCAIGDWRWLYDDQGTYGQLKWIVNGGDTIILDNTKQWRVGWDGDGSNASSEPWCWGWSGGPYGCFNPTVPSGSAAQHTRILGRNFANCSDSLGQPDKSKMTQLFGGHGVGAVLNLDGAQYVDVQCVELTRHSQCVRHGSPMVPGGCSSSIPLDDYDSDGIITDVGTRDLLLQDIWDHGHTDRGIIGPIGGLVTANRVDIDANGMAGWDFDNGSGTASVNATLKMTYSTVEWSGCNQEYPAVHAIPVISCYGQSSGGYGDGIATPATSGMDVYIDHSTFRYNTQDGPDFVHVDTGQHAFQFTNNQSYGNSGAALKWGGGFKDVLVQNNLLASNCSRLSAAFTAIADGYNGNLGDFCRAQNGIGFGAYDGNQINVDHNTIVGYAPTLIDPQCTDTSCMNTVVKFTYNIVRGYDNPYTYSLGGKSPGPGLFCGYGCDGTTQMLGTLARDHNLYFHTRNDGQANQPTGYAKSETATNEISVDPLFVNEPTGSGPSFLEAELDNFNPTLSSNSPAVGLGMSNSQVADTPVSPVLPVTPVTPVSHLPYGQG